MEQVQPSTAGKWAWGLALALVLGLFAGRTQVHLCDGDAQLYRVVARNAVERADLFDLTYTPAMHPQFREHLPFGVWPIALAIAVFGDGALRWLDALWMVLLLGVVGSAARRLFQSAWAAAGAVLVLGTTDSFVIFATFSRLDGATALLGTLSALPWLFGVPRGKAWAGSTLAAAGACLVKGPFGLVLLCAAVAARAIASRSPRALLWGGLSALGALLPLVAFLLHQRWLGDASWWTGYVQAQLLSSAAGGRTDGIFSPWYPLVALSRQFWPGLGLLPFAIYRTLRRDDAGRRVLAWLLLIAFVALCLPKRKLPHHVALLYPLGAVYVGEVLGAAGSWLAARARVARYGLGLAVLLVWTLVLAGKPLWARDGGCVLRSDVGDVLSTLPAGADLLLISERTQWRNVAALAAERRVVAWPVASWAEAAALSVRPTMALVVEPRQEPVPEEFQLLRATPQWSVWSRP